MAKDLEEQSEQPDAFQTLENINTMASAFIASQNQNKSKIHFHPKDETELIKQECSYLADKIQVIQGNLEKLKLYKLLTGNTLIKGEDGKFIKVPVPGSDAKDNKKI